jgi:hypothetical protein
LYGIIKSTILMVDLDKRSPYNQFYRNGGHMTRKRKEPLATPGEPPNFGPEYVVMGDDKSDLLLVYKPYVIEWDKLTPEQWERWCDIVSYILSDDFVKKPPETIEKYKELGIYWAIKSRGYKCGDE